MFTMVIQTSLSHILRCGHGDSETHRWTICRYPADEEEPHHEHADEKATAAHGSRVNSVE